MSLEGGAPENKLRGFRSSLASSITPPNDVVLEAREINTLKAFSRISGISRITPLTSDVIAAGEGHDREADKRWPAMLSDLSSSFPFRSTAAITASA